MKQLKFEKPTDNQVILLTDMASDNELSRMARVHTVFQYPNNNVCYSRNKEKCCKIILACLYLNHKT